MWEWEECNNFDVASGSTQILPSHHALKLAWGEHYDSNIISNTQQGWRGPCKREGAQALGRIRTISPLGGQASTLIFHIAIH